MRFLTLLALSALLAVSCQQSPSTDAAPATAPDATADAPAAPTADTMATTAPPSGGSPKVEDFPPSPIGERPPLPSGVAAQWVIVPGSRVGTIRANSTYRDLAASYGASRCSKGEVVSLGRNASGQDLRAFQTFLYEGLDNQAEIFWADTVNLTQPIMVRISGTGRAPWITSKGIKIGTPLSQLIALNEKDFYFLGWDDNTYEGQFNGLATWNGGRIPNTIGVSLGASTAAKTLPLYQRFEALEKFPTNDPEVATLGLTVRKLTFTFE